jgi:hypothetical protein
MKWMLSKLLFKKIFHIVVVRTPRMFYSCAGELS